METHFAKQIDKNSFFIRDRTEVLPAFSPKKLAMLTVEGINMQFILMLGQVTVGRMKVDFKII